MFYAINFERGINVVDASIDYGLSEERIGNHVCHHRDECVFATQGAQRPVSASTPRAVWIGG